ncbi:MAG: NADH:flavin oxidoreductase [Eubacteriales bacterium]
MKNDLYAPLALRHITLPGRVIRSATELFCAAPDGHIHPYECSVYRKLSCAGLGMIITAHTCVSPEGRSNPYQNAVWSDAYLKDAEEIAAAAQAHGTPCIIQLGHGGMKGANNNGSLPVITPDHASPADIRHIVKAFGQAAKRAQTAGYSGVQLHAAHLYLLSQWFYPLYNHRTDAYGGSAENRFRIIAEIFEEIKTVCGGSFPVFIKINGDDRDDTDAYHNDLVTALRLCDALGFEAAEISGWDSARHGVPLQPYFIDNIRRLKTEVSLPLIAVGGIRSASDIDALLSCGASAVSMARPFLQNPDLLRTLQNGGTSGCTGCCACFEPLETDKTPIRRCLFS